MSQTPETNAAPVTTPAASDEDEGEDEGVDPIDTAINSCRRSRNKAMKANDRAVTRILLRAESELIGLMAERYGQEDLPGVEDSKETGRG